MFTATTYRTAVDIINQRGWCQGSRINDRGEVCALGALAEALGIGPCGNSDVLNAAAAGVEQHLDLSHVPGMPAGMPAGGRLVLFNDDESTTAEHIRRALLDTATAIDRGELTVPS